MQYDFITRRGTLGVRGNMRLSGERVATDSIERAETSSIAETRATVGGSRTAAVCTEVVLRVAEATGKAPEELQPPMYELVDPDVLEAFVASGRERRFEGSITFRAYGCMITVDGDGTIDVESIT